ncbi:hypothetical protein CDV31_003262 [Fusarium ambrosium]|uniref:Peptidase S8/S53 domain-containing protein n=1 Tax=Fusarium ambrosium TaxID=131363 RepID=A0A428UU96_9HYPO|nr:hypothetical protein CDV31_003262 [Fusarium ambrosium]
MRNSLIGLIALKFDVVGLFVRMRVFQIASALLGAQVVSATALRRAADTTGRIGSGDFIVEFADTVKSASAFYDALEAEGIGANPRAEFSSRLFNGASFQVLNASDGKQILQQLEALAQVKAVWPVRPVRLNMPETSEAPASNDTTGDTLPRRQITPRDATEDTFSPHVMTQVDKLRAEGVTGKGIRVAIIDSGIDYTHPALGGCFGPGCLVEAGWDFTGDDFLPGTIEAKPDADPMDDCQGHGTHVAGTVAAQLEGNKYGFTGAAPGVKLAAYRAWGCRATSTNEILLSAFIRAFEEGADIISCSDGDAGGWPSDVWSVLATRIVDAGVPVVISAGNDGGLGLFYASAPATGRGVTGVGAVTNTMFPALLTAASYAVESNKTSQEFGFLPGFPELSGNVTLSLWSAVDADNACSALPDDTPDLSKRIVLLENLDARATGCYPQDQGTNVVAKGGQYLLYYAKDNLTMRDELYNYAEGLQGVGTVPPYVAQKWLSLLKEGKTVTVTLPGGNNTTVRLEQLENNVSGGYMGDLSSWGPTWELAMNPQIAAPGANILSTFPMAMGGYRVMTGTSMSAPLVAGIYALIGEVRGSLKPELLRRLIMSTAKPLDWFDGKEAHPDIPAPATQQGGGIAQVFDAAYTTIELSVESISFNDTDHFIGNKTFSVKNTGSSDVSLQLSHRKAPTMYTLQPDLFPLMAASFPNPIVEEWADISFSSSKINVPAGGSVDVTVTCTPPENVNGTLLPVYSGHIALTGSNSSLVLPYLGVAGSMRDIPILQPSQVYLANYNNEAPANKTYTIPRPDPANPPLTDRGDQDTTPNVYIKPTIGTAALHVDVLGGGAKGDVLGALAGWPLLYLPRSDQRAYVKGLLADGTVLDEGVYSLRVSALRVFGDKAGKDDWDVVTTVPFNLKYES